MYAGIKKLKGAEHFFVQPPDFVIVRMVLKPRVRRKNGPPY